MNMVEANVTSHAIEAAKLMVGSSERAIHARLPDVNPIRLFGDHLQARVQLPSSGVFEHQLGSRELNMSLFARESAPSMGVNIKPNAAAAFPLWAWGLATLPVVAGMYVNRKKGLWNAVKGSFQGALVDLAVLGAGCTPPVEAPPTSIEIPVMEFRAFDGTHPETARLKNFPLKDLETSLSRLDTSKAPEVAPLFTALKESVYGSAAQPIKLGVNGRIMSLTLTNPDSLKASFEHVSDGKDFALDFAFIPLDFAVSDPSGTQHLLVAFRDESGAVVVRQAMWNKSELIKGTKTIGSLRLLEWENATKANAELMMQVVDDAANPTRTEWLLIDPENGAELGLDAEYSSPLPTPAFADVLVKLGNNPGFSSVSDGGAPDTLPTTVVLTPTPGVQETPTTVSETPTQRADRIAELAGTLTWNPNLETSWSIPDGHQNAAELQYYKDIQADPTSMTKDQRVEYDQFITELRREHLTNELFTNRTALDKFLASGFIASVPDESVLAGMLKDKVLIEQWLNALSPEDISNLEMVWSAENKAAFMPTHEELVRWVSDPNRNVLNKDMKDERTRPLTEGHNYGMWLKNSRNEGFKMHKESMDISMFGEKVEWKGQWLADEMFMDFGAILRLPYGRTGILGLIKDPDNNLHKHPMIVVLNNEQPIVIDEYPENSGGANHVQNPPSVSLTTEFIEGVNWSSEQRPMVLEDLTSALRWTPQLMRVYTPSEHFGNYVQSMFFDPLTGLPVIGKTGEARGIVGVRIVAPEELINVWP